MHRLRRLRVYGFRGVRNNVELDFGKNFQSLVVVGDNGTGKSSFVDALEWLITGRITHLAREGCGDAAYRHRLLPAEERAEVEIICDDRAITGKRTLDGQRLVECHPADGAFQRFLDQASEDAIFLRYTQMRDFVDKTKTEKLKALADILGVGKLSQLRNELVSTVNQLKKSPEYKLLQHQLKEYERNLARASGMSKFNERALLEYADQVRRELGGEVAIDDGASLQESVNALLVREKRDERARRIITLRQQSQQLTPPQSFRPFLAQLIALADEVAALRRDKGALDQLVLADLYTAGTQAIERIIGDEATCPLCGSPVDRQHLLEHLRQQLSSMQAISARVDAVRSRRRTVQTGLNGWANWLEAVSALVTLPDFADKPQAQMATAAFLDVVKSWHQDIMSGDDPLAPVPVPSEHDEAIIQRFGEEIKGLRDAIQGQLDLLEGGSERQAFYDKLEALDQVARDYNAWLQAGKRKGFFDRQILAMSAIQAKCEQLERETLETVLAAVSEDVNRYYLLLHPDEGFDRIRLWPTDARGVEFEFSFHGERISPPGQLLSESHINTLGVCLFLASARHFNRHTRFLVLDDIVNSVDAGHRQPLARMLRDEFADHQLILLTHDGMWFDILQRTSPQWRFVEIAGWSYRDGLWLKQGPRNQDLEAQELLQRGDVEAAGNRARQWLERVLKDLCFDLGVPVAFRYNKDNERRMAGELLPALKSYIKNTDLLKNNATLFDDLQASQFVSNTLSHDNQFSSGAPQASDVMLFLDDVRRLEALFLCPNCNNRIAARHTPPSAKRKRCKCGKLELT